MTINNTKGELNCILFASIFYFTTHCDILISGYCVTFIFRFNLVESVINFCVKVVLFNLVIYLDRLLRDSQLD